MRDEVDFKPMSRLEPIKIFGEIALAFLYSIVSVMLFSAFSSESYLGDANLIYFFEWFAGLVAGGVISLFILTTKLFRRQISYGAEFLIKVGIGILSFEAFCFVHSGKSLFLGQVNSSNNYQWPFLLGNTSALLLVYGLQAFLRSTNKDKNTMTQQD